MPDHPSVSVVIPSYNSAELLPGAIDSVRAQRWHDLEIIVVDDGSTDDTAAVLETLAAPDMRCIHQTNAGPAAARNAGILAARGQWVAFLDADDLWLPDKLATQFCHIGRHPDAGFSYTDETLRYPDGREDQQQRQPSGKPLLLELLYGNRFGTPTVMVRRTCFEEVGLFDTQLRTGEDWDMWLRLSAYFQDVYVPRRLALVRRHPARQSVHLETLASCVPRVVDRLFAQSDIRRLHPELAAYRQRVYAWHYLVLAKSYLKHHRPRRACRLAVRAMLSHPLGVARWCVTPTFLFQNRTHKAVPQPLLSE